MFMSLCLFSSYFFTFLLFSYLLYYYFSTVLLFWSNPCTLHISVLFFFFPIFWPTVLLFFPSPFHFNFNLSFLLYFIIKYMYRYNIFSNFFLASSSPHTYTHTISDFSFRISLCCHTRRNSRNVSCEWETRIFISKEETKHRESSYSRRYNIIIF